MAERDFVSTTPPAVGIAEVLRRRLPAGRVVTDPDIVAGLSHDQAVWAPVGRAVAVVRAKSTDEVRTVVRACPEQGVPLVAVNDAGAAVGQPDEVGACRRLRVPSCQCSQNGCEAIATTCGSRSSRISRSLSSHDS